MRARTPLRPLGVAVSLLVVMGLLEGASSARAADGPSWRWPTDAARVIVRPFTAPASRYSSGHRGIDIAAGGVVLAPDDGIVHFAGFVVDRPVLSIRHSSGLLSSFEPVESELARGEFVSRGQVIGRIVPGHCSAPCVHVGARRNGEYVSPLIFLGGLTRAVLLPTRAIEMP